MAQAKLTKPNPVAAMADELGTLEKEFAPLKPKAARIEALRKALRAHHRDQPADQAVIVSGDRYVVTLGPAAIERSVDLPGLVKRIGLKAFAAIAVVTLGVREQHAPADVVLAVVSEARTGSRSISIAEKGLAA